MKKILASLGILSTLTVGGVGAERVASFDARVIADADISIKGEMIKQRQEGNEVRVEMSWKDQPGIVVKKDMGEASALEKVRGKRDMEIITEQADGNFKIDFRLNKKPKTNVFCQAIEGAEDYDWSYQPPLTQAEIDAGAVRPENVVGSYAVEHKTLANQLNVLLTKKELTQLERGDFDQQIADGEIATTTYKGEERWQWVGTNYETGKAFHIYRPEVWEIDNKEATREWAELSYADGTLCVTVDQDFLDSANYPVRVDPTFGYTSVGGTSDTPSSGTFVGSKHTSPSDVDEVTDIFVYAGAGFIGEANGVVVLNSDKSIVGGETGQESSNWTSAAWRELDYETLPSLSASTDYILGVTKGGTANFRYDTGSSGDGWIDTSNNETGITDPTDGSSTDRIWSIYATYTADSGEATTTSQTVYSEDMAIGGGTVLQ